MKNKSDDSALAGKPALWLHRAWVFTDRGRHAQAGGPIAVLSSERLRTPGKGDDDIAYPLLAINFFSAISVWQLPRLPSGKSKQPEFAL